MIKTVFSGIEHKMQQALDHLRQDLAKIRTGRASLAIFDGVRVSYYGTPTPLNQVAKLSVPEAAMILIQPYDPGILHDIEKAIQASDLGLNPANDGKVIRVPIPALTAERRKVLVKKVHTHGEESKNAIRHIRRDGNEEIKQLEKDKEISKDDEHRALEDIQKLTDEWCRKVDDLVAHKEKELLEV